jgi:hypothetical protein
MSPSLAKAQEVLPQTTGHGRGKNRIEPRNNTVCFTVTESEQRAIDALSLCTHLRRSAILTEVVTRFMAAVAESPRAHSKRAALLEFLDECQETVRAKSETFERFARKEG